MEIFKELNKKGYKHYYDGTVEELDSMNKDNQHLHSEIMQVIMWLLEKHKIWVYSHKDGGWWIPVVENYYDEADQGTIIEDLSGMDNICFDSPSAAYLAAIEYTLTHLI